MQFYLITVTNYKMVCTLFEFYEFINVSYTHFILVYTTCQCRRYSSFYFSHNDHSSISHYLQSQLKITWELK